MLATVRKTDYTNTHVDQIVTNQAMEFFQNDAAFIAVRDVPAILVDSPSGVLSLLSRADMNRDEVAVRGRESQAKRGGFKFTDLTYKTDERSLEYDLSAALAAGANPGRNPALTIPKALAYKASIHTEKRFQSSVMGATWFRTVTGNAANGADAGDHSAQNRKFWSDTTADPIADIRQEIDLFIEIAGFMPTNLRLGRKLFTAIATNPNVRAQVAVAIGSTSNQAGFPPPASEAQLSALLGLKVSVSSAIENTDADAETNAFIVSKFDGLLSYDAPSQYTDGQQPTAYARIVYQGLAPDGFQVRSFPRPELGAGGSMASVLDIYNGFLQVDSRLAIKLTSMAQ